MKRQDRAKLVREIIISTAKTCGNWCEISGCHIIEVRTDRWMALIWSRINDFNSVADAKVFENSLNKVLEASPPHVISLYVTDHPKALSMEWDGAEFRLISMKRGDWEADLFDLPAYDPFV